MKNAAHFHLLINHLPIVLPFFGLLLLTFGLVLRSEVVKRIAFGVFMMGAFGAVLAYFSGEGAEEIAEKMGKSHELIHEHEESAELFTILSVILGILGGVSLWFNWAVNPLRKISKYITMVFALIVMYFAKYTGNSGAVISHPEIEMTNEQIDKNFKEDDHHNHDENHDEDE
jgi:uncharacterized membrane protein